jgi:hypothetical protein
MSYKHSSAEHSSVHFHDKFYCSDDSLDYVGFALCLVGMQE